MYAQLKLAVTALLTFKHKHDVSISKQLKFTKRKKELLFYLQNFDNYLARSDWIEFLKKQPLNEKVMNKKFLIRVISDPSDPIAPHFWVCRVQFSCENTFLETTKSSKFVQSFLTVFVSNFLNLILFVFKFDNLTSFASHADLTIFFLRKKWEIVII